MRKLTVLVYGAMLFLLTASPVGASCVDSPNQDIRWYCNNQADEAGVVDYQIVIAPEDSGPYTELPGSIVEPETVGGVQGWVGHIVLPAEGTWYVTTFGLDINGCRIVTADGPWMFTYRVPKRVILKR